MIEALGRYRLQDELGRGAMSIIYRGYDPHIKRVLAIKTLRPEYAEHQAFRQRFVSEARAAGTLAHPGIVTIFDVGETDRVPFIAMELLEGPTLDAVVRERGVLPLRMVLKMVIQIADALDYAHRSGVVHQDIKPENIICTSDSGNVKVMDFGIAQQRTGKAWQPDEHGQIAGTPHYMSPETLRGAPIDGRSDLYALGVLLYWLLAGHTPYRATDAADLFRQVLAEPVPDLKPQYPDAPEALLGVVRTLLAKDPRDRYQTGAEVVEDLRQIDDALADHERSWDGRKIIPIRVRWTAFMSALVAITVTIGLVVVYHRQNQVTTNLAFDYGYTLSRMMALQSAEDLLLEDGIALQTMVEAIARNRDIAFLSISDKQGKVLASSDALSRGDHYSEPAPADLTAQRGEQQVFAVTRDAGDRIFLFATPIQYQDHEIGRLHVGMSTTALAAANQTTVTAMVTLMVVTMLVVFLGAYFLSRRLLVPIEILRRALWKITQGRLDARIRMHRQDEFERVFLAYNAMADSLEARMLSVHAPPRPERKVADDAGDRDREGLEGTQLIETGAVQAALQAADPVTGVGAPECDRRD